MPSAGPRLARLQDGLGALADLFLPADCPGCAAALPVCAGCLAALAAEPSPGPHPGPGPGPLPGPAVWSVADYTGSTARLVRAWKDGGRRDLDGALGRALAAAVLAGWRRAGSPPGALLVPVPSAAANRRRRGADLVTALARRAAAELRRSAAVAPGDLQVTPVLRHTRKVADQAGLGAAARAGNLSGALAVPAALSVAVAGRCCLLVDDVVTTGATLAEAARALAGAGARVPAAATVARTPRHAAAGPLPGAPEPTWRSSRWTGPEEPMCRG